MLKSEPGRGSTFSVEVPVAAPVSAAAPQRSPMRTDPAQLAGMAVLCIDNDPQILDGMEALLGGWGCRVLKAADLDAAIAAAEAIEVRS